MDYKWKNIIDADRYRERKYCQQLLFYHMPTTYVEATDGCFGGKSKCTPCKNVLPDEQKGYRKDSQGMKGQLLIDKFILKYCKKHQHDLAMGWIDYKKVYDMVPHHWMTKAMKMVVIADKKQQNNIENRADSI